MELNIASPSWVRKNLTCFRSLIGNKRAAAGCPAKGGQAARGRIIYRQLVDTWRERFSQEVLEVKGGGKKGRIAQSS